MASSSLAIDSCDHYDVFLSFRGEDTRYNFTSHLNDALCRNNIKTFIDYRINKGEEITPALERVIDGAKISIIVFSKNYVESTFCLDELVRIMECKKFKAQAVLPIFYKVDPSEVTYEDVFARHESNANCKKRRRGETIEQDRKKVEGWKSAFVEALGLAGWHIFEYSDEAKIIGEIIKEVSEKLNNCLSKGEELICTSLVGETSGNHFQKIWECLMNDHISRVGIYGMGGVGKTTIATRINNQLLEVASSFTHIYWVTVSKDSSIYILQSGIAKKINLDLSKEDDERRRAALIRKELNNKKFLLILDDVWEAYELTKDVGLPCLVDGRKLLLTSRSRRVCERMECRPIEVKPLCEKEALELFIKESKYQINISPIWGDIVGSIVKECGGLPLAIVVIGRRMRGVKEIWKWRDTLRELQKPCEGENPEIEDKVFKVLKLSYDRLPNDRCRQCLLYCSLFPEDHVFIRKDLMEYWIGEGLIDEGESGYEELDKSNSILDELIHASLLESMDKDSNVIKIHDVIRDMTRMHVKVGLQFKDLFESVQVVDGRMLKSFPSSTPHCSKLRTLIFIGYDIKELSVCFFTNMQGLSVLQMTSMDNVKSIPNSLTNLRNLRLLIVNYCFNLECIPSLAAVESLRHLNISKNENLKEIPKGIERLVNLRVLDLSFNRCLGESFPSNVVEKLSHLHTLDLRGSRVEVEAEALINLEKLQVLKLHFYNLHKLFCYVKSGHWQRLLEYNIYYGQQMVSDLEKGMCSKIMSLKAIKDVEEWKGEFGMFLPYDIQYLQLLCWESPMFYYLKSSNFVDLKTIRILGYKSRYLFTLNLAQHLLHNVQQLKIRNCNRLVEIIGRGEERLDLSNYINYPTILLPNLKILKLRFLPELRSIYMGKIVCPSLKLIQIYECDKLERLPFCMEKEWNEQNPTIKVQGMSGQYPISTKWWDSLQWDDLNAKSMYLPNLYEG